MLAIAALSARSLVDCAAREGVATVALDLFGDLDTCKVAHHWLPIGDAATLRIDADLLLAALASLAQRGDVVGWIAGSGFDGRADVLEKGAALLPLIGTAAPDVSAVRDPRGFFAFLADCHIAHPALRFSMPDDGAGWLIKDSAGCGGGQVRRAEATIASNTHSAHEIDPAASVYWQRERAGVPMSATFVANASDAVVLGFNLQSFHALGDRPFVFSGVIGPVAVSDALRSDITRAVRRIAAHYRLRGLASIDFLRHGDAAEILEVNPRPPASTVLYPRVGSAGPLYAHWRACVHGELPPPQPFADEVRGIEIVFARTALRIDQRQADALAADAQIHDLPRAGDCFLPGEPVCTLSERSASAIQVRTTLKLRREALLHHLENPA
jgi:predicted ATP-grasp superfamily ATP-dependent carboligase